jgi:Flp pilus assembly pilin Flp
MKRVHNSYRDCRNGELGAVAVEFAIILPLLALLLTGTFELGLLARDHQIIQNAAREGANAAALPENEITPATPAATVAAIIADIENVVIAYAASEGITLTSADIAINQGYDQMVIPAGTIPGQASDTTVMGSEIAITYNKNLFFGLFGFLGDPVTLRARAVFANLY